MPETSKTMRAEMEANLEQLRALRDAVKRKVHLGKVEAKQRWSELEPRVSAVVDQAEKSTVQVSRAVVDDVIRALEKLRDAI